MDLLLIQLKASIRRLLDAKGVRGRVLDKVNRYGEVVIGVILERPAPPIHTAARDDASQLEDTSSDASLVAPVAPVAPDAPPDAQNERPRRR